MLSNVSRQNRPILSSRMSKTREEVYEPRRAHQTPGRAGGKTRAEMIDSLQKQIQILQKEVYAEPSTPVAPRQLLSRNHSCRQCVRKCRSTGAEARTHTRTTA